MSVVFVWDSEPVGKCQGGNKGREVSQAGKMHDHGLQATCCRCNTAEGTVGRPEFLDAHSELKKWSKKIVIVNKIPKFTFNHESFNLYFYFEISISDIFAQMILSSGSVRHSSEYGLNGRAQIRTVHYWFFIFIHQPVKVHLFSFLSIFFSYFRSTLV